MWYRIIKETKFNTPSFLFNSANIITRIWVPIFYALEEGNKENKYDAVKCP